MAPLPGPARWDGGQSFKRGVISEAGSGLGLGAAAGAPLALRWQNCALRSQRRWAHVAELNVGVVLSLPGQLKKPPGFGFPEVWLASALK